MTDRRRPRILIVTRNLPPLVGGMERLNWNMADQLSRWADVRVVGPAGAHAAAPQGIVVREAPLKPLWKFLWRASRIVRREARDWQPDMVLAGSGLTAPLAWLGAARCGARTAVYVHGLDVAVRHPVYRAIWIRALRRMDCVVANSHPTAELCKRVGITVDHMGIVPPGVDLPDLELLEGAGVEFRRRHGLEDRRLLLSVGRLSSRKGMREFVTHALPSIVEACPDVMLLIVGDAPRQALHATSQTPESIQEAADRAGVGRHIRFLGVITDYSELGAVYRASDLHVFPVRELPGDPEGFGMVAVEAAAHGLPTVAFATGGVVDAVADGISGRLVMPGQYDALAHAAIEQLREHVLTGSSAMRFARKFAWPSFGAALVDQLELAPLSASP